VLPYHEFSIRLAVSNVPRIGEILRNVSQQEYLALRINLAK
jgi:hypothetical protein